jgi:hypothetical protein
MKTGKLYRQVFIESEDDLPKKKRWYTIKPKENHLQTMIFAPKSDYDRNYWMKYIDWYLLPVEQSERICIHRDSVGICYNGNTDYHLCPGSCSEAEYPVEQSQQKYEGFWWCPGCKRRIDPANVTFEETHEDCGYQVIWKEQITEQLSHIEFTSYCDKCNRIMVKKEVISLICMNPKCENYIKKQMK